MCLLECRSANIHHWCRSQANISAASKTNIVSGRLWCAELQLRPAWLPRCSITAITVRVSRADISWRRARSGHCQSDRVQCYYMLLLHRLLDVPRIRICASGSKPSPAERFKRDRPAPAVSLNCAFSTCLQHHPIDLHDRSAVSETRSSSRATHHTSTSTKHSH